jgi:hypothetical protein
LAQIEKAQFDLGINEFKGPLSGMRGVVDRRSLPDGTPQERHVYESIAKSRRSFASEASRSIKQTTLD